MKQDHLEKAGWVAFSIGVLVGMLAITLVWLATAPPVCHEDEVLIGGTDCVPLDDIQEAAADLYAEAVSQAGR